jgi:hypothetical protein
MRNPRTFVSMTALRVERAGPLLVRVRASPLTGDGFGSALAASTVTLAGRMCA